jgi:hypothetical protein
MSPLASQYPSPLDAKIAARIAAYCAPSAYAPTPRPSARPQSLAERIGTIGHGCSR